MLEVFALAFIVERFINGFSPPQKTYAMPPRNKGTVWVMVGDKWMLFPGRNEK